MIKEIKANRDSKLVSIPISNFCNKNFRFFENTKDPYLSGSKYNSEYKIRYTKSICVNHLLQKNKAPNIINYMSIDTEGNEYEIIKRINFQKWKILIITIEHNFNIKKRNKIYNLLTKKNYKRVYPHLSYMDDWYILKNNQEI